MFEDYVIPDLGQWLPGAALHWVLLAGILTLAGLLAWLVGAIARYGLDRAIDRLGQVLAAAIPDLGGFSPRRVLALAGLAVKEAIRRRIVVVVVVFLVLILFAGWFLDPTSDDPAKLYITFVLTATSWLILLLALFLSAMSIPTDIKNRTIYTIVTKPVRSSEIVLGRIVGFGAVGTVLLLLMAAVSYLFVIRGLSHTHEVALADLRPATTARGGAQGWQGTTSTVQKHHHEVVVDNEGKARLEMERGHWHPLSLPDDFARTAASAAKTKVETGPPEGLLVARVPVKGKLHFTDRSGKATDKGVSVGEEWTYRSYIEGASLAAGVWTFDGVTEERFGRGLPVEMTVSVFRTHKGNIEKGIPGSLTLRNPVTGLKVEARIFTAKQRITDLQFIPRTLQAAGGRTVDLFRDLVADGRVEVWLRCLAPGQYFGMAENDLYLRAGDVAFSWNFVKGYLGIWVQMMLVVMFGVLFSTFLSGPIAILATVGILVGGMAFDTIETLAQGKMLGGGPVESAIRLATQQNQTGELETGVRRTVAKGVDLLIDRVFLNALAAVLPDFSHFSYSEFVAKGFDIPGPLIAKHLLQLLGFLIPIFVAGYFFLKTREVAR